MSIWGSFLFQRVLIAALFSISLYSVNAQEGPKTPGKSLPPGPTRAKITAACTQCHNTTRITEQRLSRQQWSDQLDKMEGLGAVIPEGDRNAFLEYLTKNFGPSKDGTKTEVKKPSGN